MNGLPILRERIAEKSEKLYGTKLNPETDITVTPGGTYAIFTALTTVLRPGDEVIVFEPSYDSYVPNIETNGAIPILIPLVYPDYSIDWDLVKQKLSPKTKMIMLNSPHNPTGSILSKKDIEQLRTLVKNTNIFILSDEVYEHLIFDDRQHESMLRYPDLLERSFVCFSFGKTYHCTGWKMGYCIAPAPMMKEFRKIAGDCELTCHRAIDVSRDPLGVMEELISIGFDRILTSGGKNKALDGIENLVEMVAASTGRIQIMAGSGVNPVNCLDFVQIGVDAIHLSARTVRNSEMEYRRPGISMGGVAEISEFEVAYSSEEIIRAAISKIQELFSE
jgi:hypothetical protein